MRRILAALPVPCLPAPVCAHADGPQDGVFVAAARLHARKGGRRWKRIFSVLPIPCLPAPVCAHADGPQDGVFVAAHPLARKGGRHMRRILTALLALCLPAPVCAHANESEDGAVDVARAHASKSRRRVLTALMALCLPAPICASADEPEDGAFGTARLLARKGGRRWRRIFSALPVPCLLAPVCANANGPEDEAFDVAARLHARKGGRRWKRIFSALLALCLLAPVCAHADGPEDGAFDVAARAACLIEAGSGRVLFAKDAETRYPMASTTKVMTCLLALEAGDPEDVVTVGANASGVEGTSIYLAEGEQLSLRDLLYGLMLRSGNDAAVAIAEHISGSVSEFAGRMNARAAELGADAVFVNPHGLPADGHAASAHAMTIIAREAMRLPLFRQIVSTRRATIPWVGNDYARVLNNKNRLLESYPGATGIKTGFTKAAGRCLVFSAKRDGMELIGCVLNCPDWFGEAERMLDYGFEHYRNVTLLRAGEEATRVSLSGARQNRMTLVASEDLVVPLAEGEHYALNYETQPARAPVREGDVLGRAVVTIGGEAVAFVPLAAADDAPEWGLWSSLRRLWSRWGLFRGARQEVGPGSENIPAY